MVSVSGSSLVWGSGGACYIIRAHTGHAISLRADSAAARGVPPWLGHGCDLALQRAPLPNPRGLLIANLLFTRMETNERKTGAAVSR